MHVTQLTPRDRAAPSCSAMDLGWTRWHPASMKGLQLVVADAYAAREELLSRGVEASEITSFDERDGGTFFGFVDPDGIPGPCNRSRLARQAADSARVAGSATRSGVSTSCMSLSRRGR